MGSLRSTLRFNIRAVTQTSKRLETPFRFSLLVQGYKTLGLYTKVLEGPRARAERFMESWYELAAGG